jgi:hypothetical protein
MKVQQRHAFAGYALPLQGLVGESPIAPALSRREKPEDEVLRRWKGKMQTRTREIGADEERQFERAAFGCLV